MGRSSGLARPPSTIPLLNPPSHPAHGNPLLLPTTTTARPLSPSFSSLSGLPPPVSRSCRQECVFLPSVPPRASPSNWAGYFRVGREQGGGRWTRYIAADVCVVSVAQQQNDPYYRRVIPPPPPRPSSTMRGVATPVHPSLQRSSRTVSQEKRLTSANPGEGRTEWRSGWKCGEAGGTDLCNGVDVYARQWINIGIRRGRNDLIPDFNPGFYLRLDTRLYKRRLFLFHPFFYLPYTRERCQEPATELPSHFLLFLTRLSVLLLLRKILYRDC